MIFITPIPPNNHRRLRRLYDDERFQVAGRTTWYLEPAEIPTASGDPESPLRWTSKSVRPEHPDDLRQ